MNKYRITSIVLTITILISFTIMSLTSCSMKYTKGKLDDEIDKDPSIVREYPIKDDYKINNFESAITTPPPAQWESAALYFNNEKQDKLVPEIRKIVKLSDDDFVSRVIGELIRGPKNNALKPTISKDTKINSISHNDDILTVDLSSDFLNSEDLVVARISLANTIIELGEYRYVNILIDNKYLTDNGKNTGALVGLLTYNSNKYYKTAAYNADNSKSKINSVFLRLYFQDYKKLNLVPEIRNIAYKSGQLPRAIIEELIKGPASDNEGKRPTIPSGTVLNNIKIVRDKRTGEKGAELYFSKEFKTNFKGGIYNETLMLGSIALTLSGILDISYINIFYDDNKGSYINAPINMYPLENRLTSPIFEQYVGKRIKVYYSNDKGTGLVHEYRSISKNDNNVLQSIINNLVSDPSYTKGLRLIPRNIQINDIQVNTDSNTAVVNLPKKFFEGSEKKANYILILYSIVNSLTDPDNPCNIDEVQFLLDGKVVNNVNGISLSEPFLRNEAIITG